MQPTAHIALEHLKFATSTDTVPAMSRGRRPGRAMRECTAWRNDQTCRVCHERPRALLDGATSALLAADDMKVVNVRINRGQSVFSQAETAEYLWVLRTGAVKLLGTAWDGKPRICRVLKPGEILGIEGLVSGGYLHTAIAAAETRACRYPLTEIRKLCLAHADLQWSLMERAHAELAATQQWLVDATNASSPARARMARLLLRLRDGDSTLVHKFTREDLGLMLGITIETASRIIAAFLRERLLTRDEGVGRYYQADVDGLSVVAGGC